MRWFVVVLVACGNPPATTDAHEASVDAADGVPMRRACTSQFGSALSTSYGRLDGYLVAIVQPGGGGCSADADHVHLQVLANGAVYDVAVNVGSSGADDVHTTTRELAFPPWVEGWHTNVAEDYVSLDIHSMDIPLGTHQANAAALTADLANANHISIFGTGYGPDGAHLIHRNGSGHDGFVITEPLSSPSHARLFSFTSQTF